MPPQRKSISFGHIKAIEFQMEVGGSGVPDEGGFPFAMSRTVIRETVVPVVPPSEAQPPPQPAISSPDSGTVHRCATSTGMYCLR